MLLNLKKYKLAKIYVKDIAAILKRLDSVEAELAPYIRYKPVARVVREIRQGRVILEAHLQEAKLVTTSKGVDK